MANPETKKRELVVTLVYADPEFERAAHHVHNQVFAADRPLSLHDLTDGVCAADGQTKNISEGKIRRAVWYLVDRGFITFTPDWKIVLDY